MNSGTTIDKPSDFQGDFYTDFSLRLLYSTDGSVYEQLPTAVAFPKTVEDFRLLIQLAKATGLTLIPRTAGTSLGGQVVGDGIIVDVSRYLNQIQEINREEKWVRVQPGVVRDELNLALKPHGLFFGPETSTSNRCMIGGMVGNNSCGSHSILYGSTRDHVLALEVMLSDGSVVEVRGQLDALASDQGTLWNNINEFTHELLADSAFREEIHRQFPKPEIRRRNTGYAIDEIANQQPFNPEGEPFNLAKLICGSEGTLCFVLSAKLNLVPPPLAHNAVVAVHCKSIQKAALANQIGRQFNPGAIELIDKFILDCTKGSLAQEENRAFVEGDPAALLVVEFERASISELHADCRGLIAALKEQDLGYAYPILTGAEVGKVWELRKAGLGLLSNVPGDAKPVACIEDTAVTIADLPAYLAEFEQITQRYDKPCVYYAHIGDGEIHLRPVLDLKIEQEREVFERLTSDIADLVKKYGGSLSGEHGDGRVRSPFLERMVGPIIYPALVELKKTWDPDGVFNRGKIVGAEPILKDLRYDAGQSKAQPQSFLKFNDSDGVLRMAEKCNGSADCRKSHEIGGTMCPSYMATHDEKDTTRARANALRSFYSQKESVRPLTTEEVKDVLDACLGCKGCKKECPSNVDMAAMKSEFLHQYWQSHNAPLNLRMQRSLRGGMGRWRFAASAINKLMSSTWVKERIYPKLGVSSSRTLPHLKAKAQFDYTIKKNGPLAGITVGLLNDELSDLFESDLMMQCHELLTRLGASVRVLPATESGRAALSAGWLKAAKKHATHTVSVVTQVIHQMDYLIGLEPSSLLMLKDDYFRLLDAPALEELKQWQSKITLPEQFIDVMTASGRLNSSFFNLVEAEVLVHIHCHQKALTPVQATRSALSLVADKINVLDSGCCGMSGAFGMQSENYALSMKIGGQRLFPAIKALPKQGIVVATGHSCRHQIHDGVNVEGLHPIALLLQQLH